MFAFVVEKIGISSQKNNGLCPSHYLSAPVLSWNLRFSMTKAELDLISDVSMYFLWKKASEIVYLI